MQKSLFPGYTIGPDAYEDIVNVCPAYGKKVAIIGGKQALAAAKDKILKAMEGSPLEVTGVFWYGGEASVENMDMLRPQVADADMIFAVGGGKAIDTCKVLAHDTNRPFFTFPTIASTCASCTSLGIVYHPDGSLREYSFSKIPPNHIFIDTEIILAIIVSTGFVSNFVQVDYTTGMAHAMYNGFTILPSTEANHHLHGEVVSYGILVMLTVDKQYEERDRVMAFNKSIGLPTKLSDIHARPEDLPAVTEKALAGIDVRVYPYPVTQQMLIDGVMELESIQK